MKAILVVDIPETIKSEYLNKDLIVQLWDKHDEQYIMHDICKLKPLPQKREFSDESIIYKAGWNACIDEILGEAE